MLELAERKILRQIQGLPNNTANMAVYTLVGAEPIAITLDKNVLTFFMNIVRNSGTIECEILRRQIAFSDQRGKDFINRVEKTLSKYNLKSSSYYIENPLNKMEWKRLVGIKIKEYWKNECHNEKMEKTSLKYIEIQNNPLNEAHNIWKSVKNNSKDVKAGEIKARISTQTYIFQAKRAKFDPKVNPMCTICEQGNEDLEHFILHCKELEQIRSKYCSKIELTMDEIDTSTYKKIIQQGNLLQLIMDCTSKDINCYSTVYENIETLARNMCYEMHLLRTKRIKNLITSTV